MISTSLQVEGFALDLGEVPLHGARERAKPRGLIVAAQLLELGIVQSERADGFARRGRRSQRLQESKRELSSSSRLLMKFTGRSTSQAGHSNEVGHVVLQQAEASLQHQ